MFLPIYDVQNSGMVHAVLTWTGNLLYHTECIRDTEFDLFHTRQRVQVEIVCGRDKTQLAVFFFFANQIRDRRKTATFMRLY